MEIKLITGESSFEAGKNVISEIDTKDFEYQNMVVVPDSFSMQAENLVMSVLNIKSTFNIEVVGISRLASKILRQNNFEIKRISGLEEIFNVFKAVRSCEENFKYFHKCGVDFCLKILQVLKQFKACKISPEKLKSTGDHTLDDKICDLKLIYQEYEKLLADKLDISRLLDFFVEKVENEINLTKTNLYFVNFDSFSPEINEFICKLAKFVNKICIGIAKPSSVKNAFIFEDDILKKTAYFAKENACTVKVENRQSKLDKNALTMAKNLFSFDVEEGKSDFFSNIVTKNAEKEVDFVAKYIKNRVFKGECFKDFAVACSSADYFELIKQKFNDFGITFYCDEPTDLSATLLGRFVIKILNIAKLGFSKENFEYIVSSPLTEKDGKEERLSQISYYKIESQTDFLQHFKEYESVIKEISNLNKAKKVEDYVNILKNLIDIVSLNFQKVLEILSNEKCFKSESENSQSQELILGVLEKLSSLGGEQQISLSDFENLLLLSFKSVKVETIPSYIDAVFVGEVTDCYFEDVDTLFVLGATADALPKTHKDTAILDDEDIKKLRIYFAIEPEIKVLNRRNRLKLFECLLHAKSKLFVTSPQMEDGKIVQQSAFVSDLKKMFGQNSINFSAFDDINLSILSKEERFDRLLFLLGSKKTALDAYSKMPKNSLVASVLEKDIPSLVKPKNLVREKIKRISASQLETFFNCPFRRFLTYDLNLKEKENIEPNARLFGTFQHEILHTFALSHNLKTVTEKDIDEFLAENVLKVAKDIYNPSALKKYFIRYLQNESKIILKNVAYEQKYSDFSPLWFEKKVSVPLSESIELIGYVDRVDKSGDYVRIIDYKTGKTEGVLKDLFFGKKLQLFLYADAISQLTGLKLAGVYYFDCKTKFKKLNAIGTLLNGITLKENKVIEMTDTRLVCGQEKSDILGMVRKKIEKPGEFSFKYGLSTENLDKKLEYAKKVSLQAVDEIEKGLIEAKPLENACESCPYISICRHEKLDGQRVTVPMKDGEQL